ncbi:MAG: STAS domain-containing protein [Candidatus Ozemobacteraceae bacterium]
MGIEYYAQSGVHVFELEGCLDYCSALKVFEAVHPVLVKTGTRVLIELGNVNIISSMGYVVLLQFMKTARCVGSHIRFCNLQGVARESLEIMRYQDVDQAAITREEALSRLQAVG